jgi:hypothetical protein
MNSLNFTLIDYFTYKKNNVQALKLIYSTIDGKGNPTYASGIVFVPVADNLKLVPVFTYLHGTLTRDLDAPSYLTGIESIIGWIMAMDGYIAIEPDYLGIGDGPGTHPYLHAESEASASVDMIKAALELCSSPLIMAKPDGNLYLSGYSQGAHAALATQRELQANPIPGLLLKKTIAGSGPYSLSAVQKKYLFDHPYYPNPSFIPYLLLGYQNVYGNLWTSPGQAFLSPYNTALPVLFGGSLTVEEIDNQLPVTWESMFVPSYLENFRTRYFNPVNIDLRDNDVINWKPLSDLHLYYCTCDELVANDNSLLAYLVFLLRGSRNVTCLPLGPFSHADCAPFVLLLAKIQSDCASGINPCGISKPLPSILSKSPGENIPEVFRDGMKMNETITPSSVFTDRHLAEYMQKSSGNDGRLSIYPNPASDVAFIEIPDDIAGNRTISVYDVQGRLIISKNIDRNIFRIDAGALPEGLYNVVITGMPVYTGTFVVIR